MNRNSTRSTSELVLGAVAYEPKVVTIWDGFRAWFTQRGLTFDYVLFTTYERQVEAHFDGLVDVTWNSPLAWIETQRLAARRQRRAKAIAMRDTDRDVTSVIVVKAASPFAKLADLRKKRVGIGAKDSPQATLIPLMLLVDAGLEPGRDFEAMEHDVLLGKHGDHIGGEREAARSLLRGEVDATCMLDANHLAFAKDGTLAPGATRVLAQTPPFDLCCFSVLDGADERKLAKFQELLLGMSYDDPGVRRLLDLEGLKTWKPGRTTGYAQLERSIDRFRYLDSWLAKVAG
jgi:ABC-type phosphate/phosphonate transport system substrate-binding protein